MHVLTRAPLCYQSTTAMAPVARLLLHATDLALTCTAAVAVVAAATTAMPLRRRGTTTGRGRGTTTMTGATGESALRRA